MLIQPRTSIRETRVGKSPFGLFMFDSIKVKKALKFIIKVLLIFRTKKRNMTSAGQTMLLNVRFLQNFSFGHTCISSSESDSSTSNLESTSRSASGTSRSNGEKKKRFSLYNVENGHQMAKCLKCFVLFAFLTL